MGLFSKTEREEYNDRLEEILENKKFNIEAKNLLLSMLYNIENSYEDYYKVKTNVDTKKEFIENLLRIIEEECEEIITVTPRTEESKELEIINKESLIDVKLGKIVVYANEKDLLFSLVKLDEEFKSYREYKIFKGKLEDEYLIKSRKEVLINGAAMNRSEVIRDFNGWSWNNAILDIENININLIYQNMLILLGRRVEKCNRYDEIAVNSEDLSALNSTGRREREAIIVNPIKDAFEEVFFKEKVENIVKYIDIIALANLAKEDVEVRYYIEKKLKNMEKSIKLMEDEKKFFKEREKEKNKISKEIKKIDAILDNKELLEEEYNKRNKKLSKENKIFSVSHLANMLEEEKENLILKTKNANKMKDENEYAVEKEKLQREYMYMQQIVDAISKDFAEEIVKDIQIEFLKCFKTKVESAMSKDELVKLLYEFRYYCLLPINEIQLVKDIPALQEPIKEVMDLLIDKSIDKKVIENISNSVSLCYNILKYVFESRIVDLEKMHIQITKDREEALEDKKKMYYISIILYDYKEEEEIHSGIVNNLNLLNIKLKNTIRLFL